MSLFRGRTALIGLGLVAVAAAGIADPRDQNDDAGDAVKLFTLVYNVNNAGYVDVCGCKRKEVRQGSLTRRSSFLKQFRTTGREILLLDGGSALYPINDTVKPSEMPDAISKARLIVESYNRMGYAAMAVGPYDLIAGLASLKDLEKTAKFKLLSANLVDADGKLIFAPHAVFEVAGVKVGVFGLTLDTIPLPRMKKWAPGCRVTDPFAAAQKALDELRPKSDMVVALAYLREEKNFELVEKLRNLEILIDPYLEQGSQKTWLKKEEEWLKIRNGTLFLRSDGQGARLGIIDIDLVRPDEQLIDGARFDQLADKIDDGQATDADKKEFDVLNQKNLFRFTRMSIEPHHLSDPEIDSLIDAWKKGQDPSQAKQLESALPRKKDFLTTDGCKDCHEKQYAWWKGTKHSHAYESLVTTNDHERFDCIGCHSLGYGQAFLDRTNIGKYGDVQCESCHGTNPQHPGDPVAHSFPRVTKKDCLVCHNKDQTREDFNYGLVRRQMTCPK